LALCLDRQAGVGRALAGIGALVTRQVGVGFAEEALEVLQPGFVQLALALAEGHSDRVVGARDERLAGVLPASDADVVALGDDEVRGLAIDLTGEAKPVAVILDRALDVGDE
jgi:hypothetical protein